MTTLNSDKAVKKLVEANIKTQESVNQVVGVVKDLISALREAGEEEEIKAPEPNTETLSAKLDQLLQQNAQILRAVNSITETLQKHAGDLQPPKPPLDKWRKL